MGSRLTYRFKYLNVRRDPLFLVHLPEPSGGKGSLLLFEPIGSTLHQENHTTSNPLSMATLNHCPNAGGDVEISGKFVTNEQFGLCQ